MAYFVTVDAKRKTVVYMKKKETGWEPFIFWEEKELLETQRKVN